jgi:cellulose synthase/poly-beta-1,6-N-acetylglucosamine synthase-like glycosyltransferase
MNWLDACAWAVATLVAVPLLVLSVECLIASARRLSPTAPPPERVTCVVLIPAHDEEAGLDRTLASLASELTAGDRVLVVADNCSDRTADVARAGGADVVERSDATRRGKGYALAFGLDALRAAPPAVVVLLDADCVIGPGSLGRLVERAHARQRPVQAAYRMTAPDAGGRDRRVAAFAFLVKNVVRPLGLRRLGLPCLLTGSGMAFPWAVIGAARLGDGHIVEDMNLAVDLACAGHLPLFAPDAAVSAEFPVAARAVATQRRRWEHGHLRVLVGGVPRLLWAGLTKARLGPLALALELGVLPLSALAFVAGGALAGLGGWAAVGGSWGPVVALGVTSSLSVLALAAAWLRFGRDSLPASALLVAPFYALRKIPLYLGFLTRPQAEWIRTQRNDTRS